MLPKEAWPLLYPVPSPAQHLINGYKNAEPSPPRVTPSSDIRHNTAQHTALQPPNFRAFLSKKTPAAAMERRPQQQQAARRTLPQRGQIKARIFASLFRCLVPRAAARKEDGKNKVVSDRRRVTPGG